MPKVEVLNTGLVKSCESNCCGKIGEPASLCQIIFTIVKKPLLPALPLLFAISSYAQLFYIGGGENFSFINNESLDFVINRYNERTYLDKEMKEFNYMRGAAINLGIVTPAGFTYEIAWIGRHLKRYAETDTFGQLERRDVKIRNNSFNLGLGYTYVRESVFCPGLLLSFDFGSFKSFTRADAADKIDDTDYDKVMKETQLGFTFMLNLMLAGKKSNLGFAVRPYYQVQLFAPDFQELNIAINPGSANADADLDLSENMHNFGVQAVLMLTFRGK